MDSPFNRLNLDPQLACEFLAIFARLEYALKAGGFAKGDAGYVEPRWDDFDLSIDARFNGLKSDDLKHAVDYLLAQPPKKQVLVGNRIEWRDAPPDAGLSTTKRVLLMVRRVRNNLFHGGKFLPPEGGDNGRDERLVRHSLVVLTACIPLEPRVANAFEN